MVDVQSYIIYDTVLAVFLTLTKQFNVDFLKSVSTAELKSHNQSESKRIKWILSPLSTEHLSYLIQLVVYFVEDECLVIICRETLHDVVN